MRVAKYNIKTKSKIHQVKAALGIHCIIHEIRLSETELTIMAYFIVYGFSDETKKLILDSKILNSQSSLDNTLSKLRKMKLIEKVGFKSGINPTVNIGTDSVMGIIVKLDNR